MLAGVFGVVERQLGEGEQGIRIRFPCRDGAVQLGDRRLRVAVEELRQVLPTQHDLGGLTQIPGGDYVAGQLVLHGARVSALDLDRGGAAGEQQQQRRLGAARRAPPPGLRSLGIECHC